MAFLHNRSSEQEEDPNGARALMSGYGSGAPTQNPMSQASEQSLNPSMLPLPTGQQNSGPTATGYVNFDRFFNANQGAAKSTANKTAGQVNDTAQGAKTALGGVQSDFSRQTQNASTPAPGAEYSDYAKTGKGPAQPAVNSAPNAPRSPVTSSSAMAPSTAPDGAVSNATLSNPQVDYEGKIAQYRGQNGAYNGPTALDTMSGYGDAIKKAHQAQDQLDATGSNGGLQGLLQSQAQPAGYTDSMSQFDAGLTGAAGGQQFAQLRNQYGGAGGFEKMFGDASQQASDQAAQAQATSRQNQAAWDQIGNANDARKNAPPPPDTSIHINAAPGVGNQSSELGWENASAPANTYGYGDYAQYAGGAYGANLSYGDVTSGKYPGIEQGWEKVAGASQADADYVMQAMSTQDWADYQKAANTGPQAIKDWFNGILARRKK